MATSLKSVRATAIASVLVAAGTSSGVKITSLTYANSATAANPAGSETITVTGSGFNSGAKVYIDTLECTTTFVSSTSLTFTSPVKTVASYILYVYNTDGSSGVYPVGITYSSVPVWVTASGVITGAGINTSYSQAVSATGDGSITYSITNGSLPSGLSLNSSTGAITGTAPGTGGTSTFAITATDSQNQTASRSFSITVASVTPSVEYLVVAGGGGGGGHYAGGGGAGGYRTASGFIVASGVALTVTVGAGGSAGNGSASPTNYGSAGNNSVFSTITSAGGGGSSSYPGASSSQINGGSGGGGGSGTSALTGGAGNTPSTSPSQGNNGGTPAFGQGYSAAGGGGAGAVGSNTVNQNNGGNGGVGLQSSISGTATYYAGGGGGSGGGGGAAGAGGAGGGGTGGKYGPPNLNGIAGTVNTGGGGGGATDYSAGTAGAGGSGVVIIRYADTYSAATNTTGSPTITVAGGYRVYKWTSSGSITF